MSQFAARLQEEISSVCPIISLSIGVIGQSETVEIQFEASATEEQRSAAQTIVDAFDWELTVRENLVGAAHQVAIDRIHAAYSDAGLIRIYAWLNSDSAPDEAKTKILAVQTWCDETMYLYLMVYKPAILNGDEVEIDYASVGECPYSFTEIYTAVNNP